MPYGLPYMGSKNTIAKDIVGALPPGDRLVELFCGGCSITDCDLRTTHRYQSYLLNDLHGWLPETYLKAVTGFFRGEERWISREDFHRLKAVDPYVSLCFSFGSNCRTYMYSPDIEPYKRAIHHIVFWDDYGPMERLCPAVVDTIKEYCEGKDRKGKRLALGRAVVSHVKQSGSIDYWQSNPMFRAIKMKWTPERRGMKGDSILDIGGEITWNQTLDSCNTLERLQGLEGFQSLQSLESLERLERLEHKHAPEPKLDTTSQDYTQYVHRPGDVVYCDPPYQGTGQYDDSTFDSDSFWEWARTRDYPVYVSEYMAPEDFRCIFSRTKCVKMHTAGLTKPREECLFVHERFI